MTEKHKNELDELKLDKAEVEKLLHDAEADVNRLTPMVCEYKFNIERFGKSTMTLMYPADEPRYSVKEIDQDRYRNVFDNIYNACKKPIEMYKMLRDIAKSE